MFYSIMGFTLSGILFTKVADVRWLVRKEYNVTNYDFSMYLHREMFLLHPSLLV